MPIRSVLILIASVMMACSLSAAQVGRRAAARPETEEIAGLKTAIWKPSQSSGKAPLIVFSHGYLGCNVASTFLTQRLADAGYMVVAPNHKDAVCGGGTNRNLRPEENFFKGKSWSERTYDDRRDDIKNLLDALRQNSQWSEQIDWSRVGLMGHSLGGYTVLGLAGGWPGWKLPNIKAVLALAPYCDPFAAKGNLGGIRVPVMYQTASLDLAVTRWVKKAGGCFDKTSSPSIFLEFPLVGHFAWTDLPSLAHELIVEYSVAFLDKYVRGVTSKDPTLKKAGVLELKVK
jgi:dienelactone hydrolase